MNIERYPLTIYKNGKQRRVMDFIVEDGVEKLEYKVKNTIVSMEMEAIQKQINNIKRERKNY